MGKSIPSGHMREIVKSLNVFPYRFSSFLDHQKELVDGYLVGKKYEVKFLWVDEILQWNNPDYKRGENI